MRCSVKVPDPIFHTQQEQLLSGLEQMGLALPAQRQERLLEYLALLRRWNQAYNLTAVRQPELHVSRHILDSLAVLPYLKGQQFLDVGTGPGLPGLVLALARPDTQWTLLDSNGKKTRFLTQCKLQMQIDNVTVVQSRIENYRPADLVFDQITFRAFSTLADTIYGCQHFIGADTRLLALKGQYPTDELEQLPDNFRLQQSHPLQVAGCDGERHLLIIGREDSGNS